MFITHKLGNADSRRHTWLPHASRLTPCSNEMETKGGKRGHRVWALVFEYIQGTTRPQGGHALKWQRWGSVLNSSKYQAKPHGPCLAIHSEQLSRRFTFVINYARTINGPDCIEDDYKPLTWHSNAIIYGPIWCADTGWGAKLPFWKNLVQHVAKGVNDVLCCLK